MTHRYALTASVCFLALSGIVWAGEAQAQAREEPAAGHRFCDNGLGSNEEMAHKTEVSLAADPTGNRRLEGCRATPQQFLESYRREVRERGVEGLLPALNTVADLPVFFRALREVQIDRSFEYMSYCLWTMRGHDVVRANCERRPVEPNERVFGIVKPNGEVVVLLLGRCANPGGAEAPPIPVTGDACYRVRFPGMGVRVPIRYAYIGPRPLPGRCNRLHIAGETQVRTADPHQCPVDEERELSDGRTVTITCRWGRIEAVYHATVQNRSGSFYTVADGTNELEFPAEVLNGAVVICWELPGGGLRFATLGVRRPHYQGHVATITEQNVRDALTAQPLESQPLN